MVPDLGLGVGPILGLSPGMGNSLGLRSGLSVVPVLGPGLCLHIGVSPGPVRTSAYDSGSRSVSGSGCGFKSGSWSTCDWIVVKVFIGNRLPEMFHGHGDELSSSRELYVPWCDNGTSVTYTDLYNTTYPAKVIDQQKINKSPLWFNNV